ncbi:hypothetical protein Y032_0147g2589 [Ancylostoma ceylanicum]|uniref:Major sperm protein n=1 Tax=Ancylostoma ceylanicum TaxID=53326 RepID=A0A016T199_9BILA|nr:hypothetical protein Y032_0147g2589 [Ancylostoma ceylanicum]
MNGAIEQLTEVALDYHTHARVARLTFRKYQDGFPSYLRAGSRYVEFHGLENDNTACCHVRIKNVSDKHVIFNVRRPPPSHFGMTPKVGIIQPQEVITLFMTFSGRCSRIPDDLVWLYSIYQLQITDDAASGIKTEKFSTKTIRKIWHLHGSDDVANILHLACVFFRDSKKGRCLRRHTVRMVPELDEKGMLVEEDEYDPDLHDDQSEDLPSAFEGDI